MEQLNVVLDTLRSMLTELGAFLPKLLAAIQSKGWAMEPWPVS